MQLYSTKNHQNRVSFEEALFKGLPEDNGLFMPTHIPRLEADFLENLDRMSFPEIAAGVARALLSNAIPDKELKNLVYQAIDFPAPISPVYDDFYCLELFHGPSLAFKDFGARFMAALMSWYLEQRGRQLHILVATSGDTGSAVAQGFYKTPGIRVTILYPSGKVSPTQEKQLTTLGENITALEVNGVFDDCQSLVKMAFLDYDLRQTMNLSSANSINIARLIPQSFYYFEAFARLKNRGLPLVFSTPSGNFGNLCGGIIAAEMGLPVKHFVAATNANDIVPKYLDTGNFEPKPSIPTVSNAMDVGNPSNFPRLLALHDGSHKDMCGRIHGEVVSDADTLATISRIYDKHQYLMCPHTAVALLAAERQKTKQQTPCQYVFLGTAHPGKFLEMVNQACAQTFPLPEALHAVSKRKKHAVPMSTDFSDFKEYLLRTQ